MIRCFPRPKPTQFHFGYLETDANETATRTGTGTASHGHANQAQARDLTRNQEQTGTVKTESHALHVLERQTKIPAARSATPTLNVENVRCSTQQQADAPSCTRRMTRAHKQAHLPAALRRHASQPQPRRALPSSLSRMPSQTQASTAPHVMQRPCARTLVAAVTAIIVGASCAPRGHTQRVCVCATHVCAHTHTTRTSMCGRALTQPHAPTHMRTGVCACARTRAHTHSFV